MTGELATLPIVATVLAVLLIVLLLVLAAAGATVALGFAIALMLGGLAASYALVAHLCNERGPED